MSLAEEAAPAPRPLPRGCVGGAVHVLLAESELLCRGCAGFGFGFGFSRWCGWFRRPRRPGEGHSLWPVTLNTGLSVDEEYRLVSSFSCVRFSGFVPIT